MARKNVKVVELIAVKKPPAFSKTGWQYRKPTAVATAKRLLDYRACIRREMEGKEFPDYKAVREFFKSVAKKCSEEVRKKHGETPAETRRKHAKTLAKAL